MYYVENVNKLGHVHSRQWAATKAEAVRLLAYMAYGMHGIARRGRKWWGGTVNDPSFEWVIYRQQ